MLQLRAAVALETALGRLDRPKASYYGTRARSPEPPSPEADKSPSVTSSGRRSLTATANKTSPLQRDKSEDEKVERACRSILNKLTVEKFEPLYEQLAGACGIRTPQHLGVLMREIFEKATMQHHFIPMYADLCVRLEKDPQISSATSPDGGPSVFRALLLDQCEASFEDLLEPSTKAHDADVSSESESLEGSGGLCKRRALGNIKLVGHLMVRGMLVSKLLVECAEELLDAQKVCPEALESLSLLLTVTGPKFDNSTFKYCKRLSAVFEQVQTLSRNNSVPARVRFLLCDVLDLRKAGWPETPRPATGGTAGPMKLDEVQEMQTVELQAARTSNASNLPWRPNGASSGSPASRQKEIDDLQKKTVSVAEADAPAPRKRPSRRRAQKQARARARAQAIEEEANAGSDSDE
eukprot:gnl/TRDRNA2_/TRDRNA2_165267_c5_seq2.p1 gnl/TRDRNA2_/TRDRNA2_165267_c5~~gnl/TRDRNA2_/TRDRNA2_165267_c5_seq2.p1  ORF type:complete len:443 (-),score=99.54 gnl/TRDRNA2_/TRDRNA2_165267_c5_seq2:138-1367(-)